MTMRQHVLIIRDRGSKLLIPYYSLLTLYNSMMRNLLRLTITCLSITCQTVIRLTGAVIASKCVIAYLSTIMHSFSAFINVCSSIYYMHHFCTSEQLVILLLIQTCMHMCIFWLLPSNQSFYKQIAKYWRGVGNHRVG